MPGIEIMQRLSSPFFDIFFRIISMTAEQYVIFVLVASIYWCCDSERGELFLLTVVSGIALNSFFKDLFRIPRPFRKYPDLYAPDNTKETGKLFAVFTQTASGYSFPSGHTQTSALVGAGLAQKGKKLRISAAGVYILLVAASRMYLGVHTFWDVLAGAVLGAAFVFLSSLFYNLVSKKDNSLWLLLFTIPAFVSLIFASGSGDTFKMSGLCVGAVLGIVLQKEFLSFKPQDATKAGHFFKIIIGLAGALAFESLPKLLLAKGAESIGMLSVLDFTRYFLCGAFVSFGLPLIAKKIMRGAFLKGIK